ncbi:hydrogenase maturation nickel metallochaperone HypA [Streptomyces sp. NPDC002896]|uniref:hydrogenase maturation nickel metallochaperone HypA n=1 Tax=Streptomyces sp. NPDC002896 TaxID=3154438 RepID=UPI00331E5344
MHELSLAAAVVEAAEAVALEHGAASVESVRLRVGELAGVVPDALRFSFELVADGTVLSGAELLIDEVRAVARCGGCESEFTVGSPPLMQCPTCARAAVELLTGRELELADVQLSQSRVCAALREA